MKNPHLLLGVQTGTPPRDQDPYYGDRYSLPVYLATGFRVRWDFRGGEGWVDANWREGPSPRDYDDLPKGNKAKTVEWVLLPAKVKRGIFPGAVEFDVTIQKSHVPIPEQQRSENVPPLPAFFEKVFHEVHGNGTMQKVRRADGDINGTIEVGIRFADGMKWLVWSLAHGRTHIGVKAHRCTLLEDPPGKGERVVHDIFGAGTVDYVKPGQRRGRYTKQLAIGVNYDRHGLKETFWSFCAGKTIHLKKVKKP
jgi:hypothetical protein